MEGLLTCIWDVITKSTPKSRKLQIASVSVTTVEMAEAAKIKEKRRWRLGSFFNVRTACMGKMTRIESAIAVAA